MRFYRNAVYVLATLCFFNMLQSAYVYKKLVQIEEKQNRIEVKIPISEDLKELPLHARLRDSQIMQAILNDSSPTRNTRTGFSTYVPYVSRNTI